MKKILVTGASGFIGQSLSNTLVTRNKLVHGIIRNTSKVKKHNKIKYSIVSEINLETDWSKLLSNVECIIHCAGRSHIMKKSFENSEYKYRSINVEGTLKLANQAVVAGVKRFIFLSSIKVNGEKTKKTSKYKYDDDTKPEDIYGKSKWEAEQGLWQISKQTGLQVIIIRAPLVYGPRAKGNLKSLVKLVESGLPLPFSQIKNQRSLIGIDNLVDLLIRCIDNSDASGKTFLASDDKDLSTPDLIKLIASSIGTKANLFPAPLFLLKFLSNIFGKKKELNKLTESLRVDNSYTKEILNWTPPTSVEEGIRRMVQRK